MGLRSFTIMLREELYYMINKLFLNTCTSYISSRESVIRKGFSMVRKEIHCQEIDGLLHLH